MRQEPDVIAGYRGTRDTMKAEARANAAKRGAGAAPFIPPGKRVFQFRGAKYRFQITAPQDLRLTDGQLIRGGKAQVVQAENGLAILDIVKDATAIEVLENSPFNTKNGGQDFWDYAEVLENAAKKQAEQTVNALTNPEVLGQLSEADKLKILERLTAGTDEDFSLPGKGKVAEEKKQ